MEEIENTGENNESTEIDENTDEIDKQNDEDNKSNDDESEIEENEDDDKISNAGTIHDMEENDDFKQDTEQNAETEFELGEINQQTEEERAQQELAEQEKEKEFELELENAGKAETSSDEGEDEEEEESKEDGEGQERLMSEKDSAHGRSSISYDIGPRIRDVEVSEIVTGDFLLTEEAVPLKFYKYMDEKDEEEGQEEAVTEEEEVAVDRTPYYEKHEKLVSEITAEKLRNNILQKRLAKFFKRRKMDHVLKETDQQIDTQERYWKKLDAYEELSKLDSLQRTTITTKLDNLKLERESKCRDLQKMFEDLQIQEKDTGYGLIHTKTGKPIPDKLVERMVHRQKQQMQTVGDMRLKYIQLKNVVAEKQNAISQLDKIGENLYLMDYEQLKVENRSYMDKMEEKDEELSRLRNKCQKTIQILAHMREKSAALESDISDLSEELLNLKQNSLAVSIYTHIHEYNLKHLYTFRCHIMYLF